MVHILHALGYVIAACGYAASVVITTTVGGSDALGGCDTGLGGRLRS